jgi:hypothetical protein
LKAGLWFRRDRLVIVSPAREPSRPLSGRNATYPPVRIPRASSGAGGHRPAGDARRRVPVRRFTTPRQLMAWLGLVPSEHSSGAKVERGGITKAGNGRARRVLVEGAWSYRFPARVTSPIQARLDDVPEAVRAIAWKAQVRLCARFRRLVAAGKNVNVVTTAVAREMAAFAWAIACQVQPKEAAA